MHVSPARLPDAGTPASTLPRRLDRATRLVLPLAVSLFLQWLLRDAVGAWSRQANDVAQWLFAVCVALALRSATAQRKHMAAGSLAARYPAGWRRRLARFGEAICVLPWALFVVISGAAFTWRSVVGLEAFPDTFDPLDFVIRLAAWMLALLVALQAVVDLAGSAEAEPCCWA